MAGSLSSLPFEIYRLKLSMSPWLQGSSDKVVLGSGCTEWSSKKTPFKLEGTGPDRGCR